MTVSEGRALAECQFILSSHSFEQECRTEFSLGGFILMQPSDIANGKFTFSQDALYVGTVAGGRCRVLEVACCLICRW